MTVERPAELVAFRSRIRPFTFGSAVDEPIFSGEACGLVAFGALAGDPEVHDLSHAMLEGLSEIQLDPSPIGIDAKCADTVTKFCPPTLPQLAQRDTFRSERSKRKTRLFDRPTASCHRWISGAW